MSESKWLSLSTKRLDLGRGGGSGGIQMEYVMIGVLGLIIVLSLGLTIHHAFFGDASGQAGPMDGQMHFQCTACGDQSVKSAKEMEQIMPTALMPEMGLLQMDCGKCGAKQSCLMMIKCPNCQKYYLSAPMVANAKALNAAREAAKAEGKDPNLAVPTFGEGQEQPKDVCPHCNTDRVQWYVEYYKKKQR